MGQSISELLNPLVIIVILFVFFLLFVFLFFLSKLLFDRNRWRIAAQVIGIYFISSILFKYIFPIYIQRFGIVFSLINFTILLLAIKFLYRDSYIVAFIAAILIIILEFILMVIASVFLVLPVI